MLPFVLERLLCERCDDYVESFAPLRASFTRIDLKRRHRGSERKQPEASGSLAAFASFTILCIHNAHARQFQ